MSPQYLCQNSPLVLTQGPDVSWAYDFQGLSVPGQIVSLVYWLCRNKPPPHDHCHQTPLHAVSEWWSMRWNSLWKPGALWHPFKYALHWDVAWLQSLDLSPWTIKKKKVCWGYLQGNSALAWTLTLTFVTSVCCICAILFFSLFHSHSSSSAWLSSGAERKDKGDPKLISPLHHAALVLPITTGDITTKFAPL